MGMGYQSLLRDLGQEVPVRVWTDSSASIGICSRQGLGKLRHLDTHTLWIQQAVRSGRVDLRKVAGEVNPADLFTKHSLSRERLSGLTVLFSCHFRGGRAESAPKTRTTATARTTMADACDVYAVQEQLPEMPHLSYTGKELDELFPSLVAPPAVDTEDLNGDKDDHILQEGMRLARDIAEASDIHGRLRRMRPTERDPSC